MSDLVGTHVRVKAGTKTPQREYTEAMTGVIIAEATTLYGAPILRVKMGEIEDYFFLEELIVDASALALIIFPFSRPITCQH